MTGCSPSCWWSPCSQCPPRRRRPRCTPPRICPAPRRLPEVTRMFCPHPDVSNYLLEGGDVVPRVGWWIINALEQDRSLGDQQGLVSLQFFCLRRELEKLEHLASHNRHKIVTCVTKCHEHHIVTKPYNETFIRLLPSLLWRCKWRFQNRGCRDWKSAWYSRSLINSREFW